MKQKSFRVYSIKKGEYIYDIYDLYLDHNMRLVEKQVTNDYVTSIRYLNPTYYLVQLDTGMKDKYGKSIYEGDRLKSCSSDKSFFVKDCASFLMMCGRYEEKNGESIFSSIEVSNDAQG